MYQYDDDEPISDEVPETAELIDENGEKHSVRGGGRRHDALSVDQWRRVGRLAVVLAEANPLTIDDLGNRICEAGDPGLELALIEAVAVVYSKLAVHGSLDAAEKRSLYETIVAVADTMDVLKPQDQLPAKLAEMLDTSEIRIMLDEAFRMRERP
jgi:hypothetical protein